MVRFAFAVVLISGVALAQAGNDTSPQSANAHDANAKQITVRGCLSGDQRYSFTQAATGAVFSAQGDPQQLASAKGKLIDATATEMPPDGASAPLPRLQIQQVKVVADKCPVKAVRSRPAPAASASPTRPGQTSPYSPSGAPDQTPPAVNNPNVSGASGAPSAGTGNAPAPPRE